MKGQIVVRMLSTMNPRNDLVLFFVVLCVTTRNHIVLGTSAEINIYQNKEFFLN